MTDQTMIERVAAAVIAQLHLQGEARGVTVEDNARSIQVDGSFEVQPLVRAMLTAMREPTEEMLTEEALADGFVAREGELEENFSHDRDDANAIWRLMIDATLAEG